MMTDAEEFVEAVARMRQAQRAYFRAKPRTRELMLEAMHAEAEVDGWLRELQLAEGRAD